MTDTLKTEDLTDADLDKVQGGATKSERKPVEAYNGQQGDEGAMVKSDRKGAVTLPDAQERKIIAASGSGSI